MKFLFLLNPLKSPGRKLRNGALLGAVRESREVPAEAIRVCAPGPETRGQAREELKEAGATLIPPVEEERSFLEEIGKLQGKSPEATGRRSAYCRGEGPAAEALFRLVRHIHSRVFDFDVIVSTLPAPLLDRAAAERGALSVRTELWPGIWGRWLYFSIVRCRTPRGIDPLEQLEIADLRDLGLHRVPASVDQRLHGTQPQVNPFESKFAPLGEDLSRAFRPGRRTALVLPQTASDLLSAGGNAFPDARAFLDGVLPPLLKAGWLCLIIGETDSGRRLAGGWADRDGVFLIDEGNEFELKEGRRKILALLAQSDLVVTDNSPTALEAMIYERPVCVLGRPFFALRGAFPGLEAMVSGGFDEAAYREAGSLIRAFFLRAYGAPFFGPGAARDLLDRIRTVTALTRQFEDQPRRWAQAIQEKLGNPNESSRLKSMREVHTRVESFTED